MSSSSPAYVSYCKLKNTLITKQLEVPDKRPNGKFAKNIIWLVMENRSFHNIFGYKELYNGINKSCMINGKEYKPTPIKSSDKLDMSCDPPHDYKAFATQLGEYKNGKFAMDGFLKAIKDANPQLNKKHLEKYYEYVMSYYEKGTLKTTHYLGEHYALCTKWFTTCPADTITNRAFIIAGTNGNTLGSIENIIPGEKYLYDSKTIFDVLYENDVSFNMYSKDVSNVTNNVNACKFIKHGFKKMNEFYSDVKNDTLPSFSYIEPNFCIDENDFHPWSDIRSGDDLITNIYNKLVKYNPSDGDWLFIISFDEHGGFYDYLSPPLLNNGNGYSPDYKIKHLGPRTPAIMISPKLFSKEGNFKNEISDIYDNCSVLNSIMDNFNIPTNSLTERVASSPSFINKLLSLASQYKENSNNLKRLKKIEGERYGFSEIAKAGKKYDVPSVYWYILYHIGGVVFNSAMAIRKLL